VQRDATVRPRGRQVGGASAGHCQSSDQTRFCCNTSPKRLNVTLNEYYLRKTMWEKFEDLRTMYLCKTPKTQWEKIGEGYNIEM
jgi:hypothetical protein